MASLRHGILPSGSQEPQPLPRERRSQDLQCGFVELIGEDPGIEIGFILNKSPSPPQSADKYDLRNLEDHGIPFFHLFPVFPENLVILGGLSILWKLLGHRPGLPGKVMTFHIVPLDPACKAGLGHVPVEEQPVEGVRCKMILGIFSKSLQMLVIAT